MESKIVAIPFEDKYRVFFQEEFFGVIPVGWTSSESLEYYIEEIKHNGVLAKASFDLRYKKVK